MQARISRKSRSYALMLVLGSVLLALPACSSEPKVSYAEVSGKVTLANVPLAGAEVAFYPVSDGKAQLPIATAKTEADGSYAVKNSSNKGAVVGKNRVVVAWPSERGDPDKAPRKTGKPPIPVRYTVASDTPLVIDVKAGEPQVIDLPLQKK